MTAKTSKAQGAIAVNRKAAHDYTIIQRLEAGLSLMGSEVKSIKGGKVNLAGGYASVDNGELILHDVHITPYDHAGYSNHEATRPRRLLMRGHEIRSLADRMDRMGLTMVPLKLFTRRRWIKIELGLCRGKKVGDKREALRRKDAEREVARAVGAVRRGK